MNTTFKRTTSLVMSAALLASFVQVNPTVSLTADAADYSWSSILKYDADWFGSSEGTELADTILQYQLDDGGWRKAMDDESAGGSWAKSTIDNDTTTSQIRVLARVYNQTGIEKYKTGCLDGIDLLIDGQYDNGGWPQVFDDAGTYHAHITYNDNAMIHVMEVLTEVRDKDGDFPFVDDSYSAAAETAVDNGLRCILDTQIEINGELTAWCQQHDEYTLEPTSGRAYELASLSSSESSNIVTYLRSIENPSSEIIRSINAAVTWMSNAQLNGIEIVDYTNDDGEADRKVVENPDASPIWSRFYYLTDGTTPMFVDRESNAADNWDHLGAERRKGYAWYGTWPKKVINAGLVYKTLNGTYVQDMSVLDVDYCDSWSIAEDIQIGDLVFGDRDVTYASLPDELIGAEYIRTACDSKYSTDSLASFTAAKYIDVYVAIDARVAALPEWLSDWTNTGLTAVNNKNVTFNIYTKDFSAGDTVTLGANGQSGGCVGYAVFVKEQENPPEITTTLAETELPVLDGTYIQSLNILDTSYGSSWSIDEDIQIDDLVFGDRDVTYASLPDELIGAEYIRTACDSKNTDST
ncbi:MAG: pectate lyase, partial [Oscillospiraceae bacterium]|nr:pectate lyase [Oscillospiraceae bacterium]